MIIIQTENSNLLVNNKEIVICHHDKATKTARIIRKDAPDVRVEDVEKVKYMSDADPSSQFESDGNELENAKKEIKSLEIRYNAYRESTSCTYNMNKILSNALGEIEHICKDDGEMPRNYMLNVIKKANSLIDELIVNKDNS